MKLEYKLIIILMLYNTSFLSADAQTVNINGNGTSPRWSVRQLLYILYLRNFMIAQ